MYQRRLMNFNTPCLPHRPLAYGSIHALIYLRTADLPWLLFLPQNPDTRDVEDQTGQRSGSERDEERGRREATGIPARRGFLSAPRTGTRRIHSGVSQETEMQGAEDVHYPYPSALPLLRFPSLLFSPFDTLVEEIKHQLAAQAALASSSGVLVLHRGSQHPFDHLPVDC